ncbi:MAG: NAD-dependent epimerase/dehydratase family protein, partial [Phormidesmis sp.]
MQILITGGAGFLGQRLAQQLLKDARLQALILADVVEPTTLSILLKDRRVTYVKADLTDVKAVKDLMSAELTAIYHLAAVVSGQAEANFDLGMAVNGEGTRHLLEAVRHQA